MVKGGGSLCLSLKPSKHLWVFGDLIREELQGYGTVEADIFGLVNHPHTTATKFLDDSVMRDGLPNHWADMLGIEFAEVNEHDE